MKKHHKKSSTEGTKEAATLTDTTLTEAATCIKAYKQTEAALIKASAAVESAEQALDAEGERLSKRDAELLQQGAPASFTDWEQDPKYAAANRALMQSRAVLKACREKVKAAGAALEPIYQKFRGDRTAASTLAIAEWKSKYWNVVLEAATAGRLLEQTFECSLQELDELPTVDTPHDAVTGSSPWIQTAKDLESISKKVKVAAETEGMYKVVQGFTWDSRNWQPGTLISSDWFAPPALVRLKSRGVIAAVVEDKIEPRKPLTVEQYEAMRAAERGASPGEHLPGRPFYYKEPKPAADDWSGDLGRESPSSTAAGTPWLSPSEGGS